MLGHSDPVFASRIIVFLLAGHLTGVTTCAIIIIYEQSVFAHLYFPPSVIFVSFTRVVLYCPPPKPDVLHWGPGMILLIW